MNMGLHEVCVNIVKAFYDDAGFVLTPADVRLLAQNICSGLWKAVMEPFEEEEEWPTLED